MSKYDPKPLIEEHYHIQDLINNQQKRADDRTYHRELAKEAEERNGTIKEAQIVVVTDFWCHRCKEDFKSMSIKEVEIDWSCSTQYIAFYKAKCSKGHWGIRLITDKIRDGFWTRSMAIKRDQVKGHNDALQPHETGFQLLYGKGK